MLWPGIVPPYRQLFYQICDLKLPEVQDVVNENNFKVRVSLSFVSG